MPTLMATKHRNSLPREVSIKPSSYWYFTGRLETECMKGNQKGSQWHHEVLDDCRLHSSIRQHLCDVLECGEDSQKLLGTLLPFSQISLLL